MTSSAWSQAVYKHIMGRLQQWSASACVILVCSKHLVNPEVESELRRAGWQTQRLHGEPMALRHTYECHYRTKWPQLEQRIMFLVENEGEETVLLPFDVQRDNPVINVEMTDFFPALDASILQLVPPEKYETLFRYNQASALKEPLLRESTLAFVLQACYGLNIPAHPTLPDYFRLLADLVQAHIHLPRAITREVNQYLKRLLKISAPLDVAEAKNILRSVWETYRRMTTPALGELKQIEESEHSPFLIEAAALLDKSAEMQAVFTCLCRANLLPKWEVIEPPPQKWLMPNVHYVERRERKLEEELESLIQKLPSRTASWDMWTSFALAWAEFRTRYYDSSQENVPSTLETRFHAFHRHVEQEFFAWLLDHYSDLLTTPFAFQPYVVHHLLHFLTATYKIPQAHTLAIVVLDGMALEDWFLARSYIDLEPWHYREHTLAAYIPTLTAVSRQALLSGKKPVEFASTLETTDGEQGLWSEFWLEQGLDRHQIGYWRGVGWDDRENIREVLTGASYRVIAIVIDTLDKMLHHAEDPVHFHAQWKAALSRYAYLKTWLDMLSNFFDIVVLTSDHGHVEGVGVGDIALGKVAEMRALRARIFKREMQPHTVEHPHAVQWPNIGLPTERTVVLASDLSLFAKRGKRAIAHGGASLEEVIIPAVILTGEK